MSHSRAIDDLVDDLQSGRIERRQFLGRAVILGLSASGASALLAACGGGSSGSTGTGTGASSSGSAAAAGTTSAAAKNGSTLRVRMAIDIANLDPALWPALEDSEVDECVLEGLVSFKPGTFDVVNTLAETFEASTDHLSYHFTLKQGIEFHGGYGEVTADDVKFSFERIAGLTTPKVNSPYQGDWDALSSVKVESKYAGTIVMKRLFAPLLHSTLPAMSGKIISKKAAEALGKKFATHPIGTGPYEFVEWIPQQHVTLRRFAKYGGANSSYAQKAEWETISILPITDDSAAKTALASGDVDFGAVSTGDVDHLPSNLQIVKSPTLNYYWVSMNAQDPVLRDPNVRQAVRYGIDVPGIITAAYNGKWERANAIIPKGMGLGYWADAPTYEHDPEKAKSYLAKSGLKSVDLRLNVLNAQADKTAGQVIQASLGDAGIKTQLISQDSATLYAIPGGGGGGKQRQLNYNIYVSQPDPSWSFVWWTSKQIGLWNWANWADPSFQKMYDAALTTFDDAKRNELYVQMQQLWDKEANVVWVAYPTDYYAGKKSIKASLRPDGMMLLWNFRSA